MERYTNQMSISFSLGVIKRVVNGLSSIANMILELEKVPRYDKPEEQKSK